ncbi:hypothetical protein [Streptomyces sp. NPDC085529]|uniref:hypothetical protein n=1 Tax=Streptomyces sp. NPDC085529 TaxID=3365729 RepID=UPI0037D3FC54
MTNSTAWRQLRVRVTVAALTLGLAVTTDARADPPGEDCPAGQIYATNNTAIITDPADPRLRTRLNRFDHEVRAILHAHGARPGASRLLDGVFWSGGLQQATYERSREFEVEQVNRDGLRHVAGVIVKQYRQEAVLTFRCLPRTSPETDAVEIEAPGVTAARLRDALLANPEARDRLGGGSVTLDGRLVLIAPLAELPWAKKFTQDLGVDWSSAEVRYGDGEFVSRPPYAEPGGAATTTAPRADAPSS